MQTGSKVYLVERWTTNGVESTAEWKVLDVYVVAAGLQWAWVSESVWHSHPRRVDRESLFDRREPAEAEAARKQKADSESKKEEPKMTPVPHAPPAAAPPAPAESASWRRDLADAAELAADLAHSRGKWEAVTSAALTLLLSGGRAEMIRTNATSSGQDTRDRLANLGAVFAELRKRAEGQTAAPPVPKSDWFSAADRTPAPGEWVMCTSPVIYRAQAAHVVTGEYVHGRGWVVHANGASVTHAVTHWKPISPSDVPDAVVTAAAVRDPYTAAAEVAQYHRDIGWTGRCRGPFTGDPDATAWRPASESPKWEDIGEDAPQSDGTGPEVIVASPAIAGHMEGGVGCGWRLADGTWAVSVDGHTIPHEVTRWQYYPKPPGAEVEASGSSEGAAATAALIAAIEKAEKAAEIKNDGWRLAGDPPRWEDTDAEPEEGMSGPLVIATSPEIAAHFANGVARAQRKSDGRWVAWFDGVPVEVGVTHWRFEPSLPEGVVADEDSAAAAALGARLDRLSGRPDSLPAAYAYYSGVVVQGGAAYEVWSKKDGDVTSTYHVHNHSTTALLALGREYRLVPVGAGRAD